MPKGLNMPVGVDGRGGAATVDSDENDSKIIMLALSDCDSEHAFQQDLGLGGDVVFDNNDAAVRARITRRITQAFILFEQQKRYRLRPSTLKWTEDSKTQELILEFQFINLESDEPKNFKRTFRKGG